MPPIWTHRHENVPIMPNHTSAAFGHIIYSFGGYTLADFNNQRPMVVHSLDTNTLEWSSVPCAYDSVDDIPFNRFGHTVIADGHIIYLWGGKREEGGRETISNVLFAFNCQTLKWSRPMVSGVVPEARAYHSATVCGRKIYMFGGRLYEDEEHSQDVYSLDLDTFTWNYIVTHGIPAVGGYCHSLSGIDDTLYVFGGITEKEDTFRFLEEAYGNEIVCLDLRSQTWSRPVTKNSPIGRAGHSAFVIDKCLYIFGGYNEFTLSRHLNDLLMYNPVTRQWTEVSTQGKTPSHRHGPSCHLVNGQLFLFGGTSWCICTDLFILDLAPSLKTLAQLVIIKHDLSTTRLPIRLQKKITDMAQNIVTQ